MTRPASSTGSPTGKVEVLPPGSAGNAAVPGQDSQTRGAKLFPGKRWFDDDNLDLLSHVLDDWFRVPGTSIRFGVDGIIGLIPGIGDVIAGLASCVIVLAAWVRGLPYVTLLRMLVNLGISVLIGAVPLLGDAFDIAWKANRRNYALLVRHLEQPRIHTWRDWIFLILLGMALAAIFLAPLILLVWILHWLAASIAR